jgi:hypothetical protein
LHRSMTGCSFKSITDCRHCEERLSDLEGSSLCYMRLHPRMVRTGVVLPPPTIDGLPSLRGTPVRLGGKQSVLHEIESTNGRDKRRRSSFNDGLP